MGVCSDNFGLWLCNLDANDPKALRNTMQLLNEVVKRLKWMQEGKPLVIDGAGGGGDVAWIARDADGNIVRFLFPMPGIQLTLFEQLGGYGVPSGIIVAWSGSSVLIPDTWVLCDGNNGTPDLSDRFIVGKGKEDVLITGGYEQHGDAYAAHGESENNHEDHVAHEHPPGALEEAFDNLGGVEATGAGPWNPVTNDATLVNPAEHDPHSHVLSAGICELWDWHSNSGNDQDADDAGTTTQEHTGDTDNRPPYMVLCWIMKL